MHQPRAATSLGFSQTSVSPFGRRNVRPRTLLSQYANTASRGRSPLIVPRPEECFRKPPPPPLPGQTPPAPRRYDYTLVPARKAQHRFQTSFKRVSAEQFKTGIAQHVADYVRDGESVLEQQPREWPVFPQHMDWQTKGPQRHNVKITGDSSMWGRYSDRMSPGALRGCPDLTSPMESRFLPRDTGSELGRFVTSLPRADPTRPLGSLHSGAGR